MITPYTPVAHIAAMQANLITQFRNTTVLASFIKNLGQQLNDLDEFFAQIFTNIDFQNSSSSQLDDWGSLLQQSRNGLSDDAYRTLLQAKVNALSSQGTVENIIQILLTMAGAQQVQVIESSVNADITVNASAVGAAVTKPDIFAAVFKAKLAGVGLTLNVTTATLPVFQFDLAATGNNAGFDVGHLAGLIS